MYQGTLSILCSRIQGYMLSLMNEVDPCLLLLLCILYEVQNQIYQKNAPINSLANKKKLRCTCGENLDSSIFTLNNSHGTKLKIK